MTSTSTTEPIPQYTGPASYRGPSMGHLIRTHTLADQIIATHPHAPANILDASELALLRLYVTSSGSRMDFLREHGMMDAAEEEGGEEAGEEAEEGAGERDGEKAGEKVQGGCGSLVGFAIASDAFDQREVEMLRGWFASGVLDQELEGVRPTGLREGGGSDALLEVLLEAFKAFMAGALAEFSNSL